MVGTPEPASAVAPYPVLSHQPLGAADTYFIRADYRHRSAVEYFTDSADDGVVWQPDVYPYTASLVLRHGADAVIDLGCGRAAKLAALAAEQPSWSYTGVDFGPNLAWCSANHPFGEWFDADLEKTENLQLDPALLRSAVIVCSDVIEHLLDPLPLLALTRNLLTDGCRAAVFSTPAREFRSGYDAPGPPRNTSHVREWACDEFQALLRHHGFEIHYAGLTRSDDASNGMSTQLVTVGLPEVRR
ncbi:class I SAM-dependent methyltransferase [Streptacidiphilus sp. EB129]|uniref:class I SAM-dependent methyltransferase n=1 Tax=Streptacidiphilus sp. EB129 TaxID=3156262 RepID=UPI00351220D0